MKELFREQRRTWIRSALGCSLGVAGVCASAEVAAHTPYRQWTVYRRKHLLLGCHKNEPVTYELAKKLVEQLNHLLPEASARVARAPDAQRLASLMATDQLDSAVLAKSTAIRMAGGKAEFAPYGRIALRKIKQLDQHVLVCRADIPDRHAFLIAEALNKAVHEVPANLDTHSPIAWHPGVLRLRADKN